MRWREFITLLGGVVFASPLGAHGHRCRWSVFCTLELRMLTGMLWEPYVRA
jgi:hypothetical protein